MSGHHGEVGLDDCIRKAREDDLPLLSQIEELSSPVPWNCLLVSGAETYVYQSRELAGFIVVRFQETTAHVLNLAVHPSFRRRGIAKQLLDFSTRGFSRVVLELRESNQAALALYLRSGFKIERKQTAYYSNGEAGVLMSRDSVK